MHKTNLLGLASIVATTGFLSAAAAQTSGTYPIEVSGVASPSNPTVRVEVWSTWEDPFREYGFQNGTYDLIADDGLFSNAVANPNLNLTGPPGWPNTPGVVQGNRVTGAEIDNRGTEH